MRRGVIRDRNEEKELARLRENAKKVYIFLFVVVLCVLAFLVYNLLIDLPIWKTLKNQL